VGALNGPLAGLRVVDVATLFAGPLIATQLSDFGAEVIKVEHPRQGDPARGHGPSKNGHGLWWKVLARNKLTVTLDLGHPEGGPLFLRLIDGADVLIENFRPGTLERWSLGPEILLARNPRLVMARVTGFGQSGPYAGRPAFGTLAEAMSGFAHITGDPDGPPTLPPFGLADGITGLAGVGAVLMALRHRDLVSGRGQVIDLAIIEPMLAILGAQPTIYDQLGIVQGRSGNRSVNNAPRNTYRTRDGRWVAVSSSATRVAGRLLRLVGHPEVIEEPWFDTSAGRATHADLLDALVGGWVAAHDLDDVLRQSEAAAAAVAPIYDIADVLSDPQYVARQAVVAVDDEDLGPIRMQNVMFRLSETPGSIRGAGRRLGQDNARIYGERLGLEPDQLAHLKDAGAI
jgi:crotonobetainyl-CoA:carnitine CoA-transferase CaiB-like acyl-CoA transferase